MLLFISPAKRMDFAKAESSLIESTPIFGKEANELVKFLRTYNIEQLEDLMKVSRNIADLNHFRFQQWKEEPDKGQAKPAAYIFNGDTYIGLKAELWDPDDQEFAQQKLRILSGLYGLLKPFDLIQAYRLEMGTRLESPLFKDLYHFWNEKINGRIQEELKNTRGPIINLASDEYFKVLNIKKLGTEVIKPVFKDFKNGKYQFFSFQGKKARGLMASYIIKNKISNPEDLKLFSEDNYFYNERLSSGNEWYFTRD